MIKLSLFALPAIMLFTSTLGINNQNNNNNVNSNQPQQTVMASIGDYFIPHELTIVRNDGKEEKVKLYNGANILKKVNITRDNYTFGGLFIDEKLTKPITKMGTKDITAYVWWKEENKPANFEYTINENNAITITKYIGDDSINEINIPDYIGNKPVTLLKDNSLRECSHVNSIKIGNNVIEIQDDTFFLCDAVNIVTISDSVTYIAPFAFSYCTNLENIVIGNSELKIGESAFWRCEGIRKIFYKGNYEDWNNKVHVGSDNRYFDLAKRYYYSEVKKMEDQTFYWHYVNGLPMPWDENDL